MEIQIPRQVYAKIMHWINKSNDEVSGFGRCTYYKETKVLYVHDAYLLKQKNGAAHTDIDGQALAKLMYKTKDEEGELKWWWHSHVNMAVFWSGTDTATIKELASQGWMGATVFNKKEETRSAIGMLASTALMDSDVVIKDDLPTYIMDYQDEEEKKLWDKEYDDNIEKTVYQSYPSLYDQYDTYRLGGGSYMDRNFPRTHATKVQQHEAQTKEKAWASEEDRAYYIQFGWTGAGAFEEARVLKMPMDKWLDMLLDNDVKVYDHYDQILDQAIATGQIITRKET